MSRPLERFADARVLIIDDNLDNLDLMAAVLGRAGLRHVRTESQVLETTSLLASSEPDLIVLDLHMPHVDGFAMLREVMAFAAGSYLPVLVVSADISRDALHRALAGGARDFVTKPFDTVELLLRVRNLLETRFLHVTVREHMLTSKNGELRQPVSQLDQAGYQRVLDRIRQALGPAGFQIALQPIVDTNTSQPVGFEALSRFSGPPEQPPDEWFAAAAEVGLGTDLEVAAVRRALSYLPEVQSRHSGAFLAVNASPSTVLSGRLDE
ncbi:MAG: response regulator, partial [Jatrophihabitantaceae bacterium]